MAKHTLKFPKIYRFITETDRWFCRMGERSFWIPTISVLTIVGLLFGAFMLVESRGVKDELSLKRVGLMAAAQEWEETKQKFPGYRDAYFALAVLYYQLGEREKARENLDRALEIDPNFEGGREMEKLLK